MNIYQTVIGCDRFIIFCTTGYTTIIKIVLNAAVGNTTVRNKTVNTPSIKPTIYNADNKKMVPLIKVPIAVNTGALIVVFTLFLTSKYNPKNNNAVIGLSIRFAICPPGASVVNADIMPVTIDNRTTYLSLGKRIIPKNIIDSNMSGFIPNNIDGTTVCKTAPIPTNKDKMIKTLLFILNSPLLSYAKLFVVSQLYTRCQLQKRKISITNL